MSTLGRAYYRLGVAGVFEAFGVDPIARHGFRRFKEWSGGKRTIEVGGISAMFSDFSLIPDAYLEAELAVLDDLLSELQDGDVVYDVGADGGLYAVFAALSDRPSDVVAFEPNPYRRGSMARNLRRNGATVTVRGEALANMSTRANLTYRLQTDEYNAPSQLGTPGITVDVERGDGLVREGLPEPNVMKIDVEGAELSVLEGFASIIAEPDCRVIYIEAHDKMANFGDSESELIDHLEGVGFDVTRLEARSIGEHEESFFKAVKKR